MKRLTGIVAASLLVALAGFGCGSMSSGPGWVTLIDGDKGLDNWYVTGTAANWRAEDGAILPTQAHGAARSDFDRAAR